MQPSVRGGLRGELKALFRLGAPVLVTQAGVIIVSFADTMMVGSYGTRELAAAAFVNSLFVVPMVMLMGFAGGITPIAGALYGRGEIAEAGRTLRGGLQVNLLAALVFTLLMSVLYFFVDRFGQDACLLPLIRPYYLIVLAGLLPQAVFNSCQQTANGLTDTAMPMWMMLGANVLNIVGNWLLIFGNCGFPELGLEGAGISTLFARCMAAAGIVAAMGSRRRYAECRRGFRLAAGGRMRRRLWHTSYPVMFQNGAECALWSVGAVVCGWFGATQLAAYQIVNTIAQLGFMVFISFGVATSIRVANYTGVRCWDGVRLAARAGILIAVALATVASLIFIFGGRTLIEAFTADKAVVAAGVVLITPLVVYQYFDAISITCGNALRGTAEVRPLLWVAVGCYTLFGIPVLLLMASVLGLESMGVYYSFDLSLLAGSVSLFICFRAAVRRLERAG